MTQQHHDECLLFVLLYYQHLPLTSVIYVVLELIGVYVLTVKSRTGSAIMFVYHRTDVDLMDDDCKFTSLMSRMLHDIQVSSLFWNPPKGMELTTRLAACATEFGLPELRAVLWNLLYSCRTPSVCSTCSYIN